MHRCFSAVALPLLLHSLLTVLKRPVVILAVSMLTNGALSLPVVMGNLLAAGALALRLQSSSNADMDKCQHRTIRLGFSAAVLTIGVVLSLYTFNPLLSSPWRSSPESIINVFGELKISESLIVGSLPPLVLPPPPTRQNEHERYARDLPHCNYTAVVSNPPPMEYWHRLPDNFGDFLNVIMFELFVNSSSGVVTRNPSDPEFPTATFRMIGSVLTPQRPNRCDVVWGAGARAAALPDDYLSLDQTHPLDVRAVRGPWTRRTLQRRFPNVTIPAVYGDPALLLPYLRPELGVPSARRNGTLVVLHFNDLAKVNQLRLLYPVSTGVTFISALEPWERVVSAITRSRLVLSSALHGLITADAYGVPARYLQLSCIEPQFKYADYYAGTGRTFQPVHTIEEGLWLGGELPLRWDPRPLLRAFPIDLYPHARLPQPTHLYDPDSWTMP